MEFRVETLDEFELLRGFKFLEARESTTKYEDGRCESITAMKFVNEKNVAVDVLFVDGEIMFDGPYAVTDEYEPLKDWENKE